MANLWYVPLEPLDKRYTVLMDKQLQNEFVKHKIKYEKIGGETLRDEIKVGSFLDAVSTNYYKLSQLQKILKLIDSEQIKNGDTFFFSDLWFPGIEAIPYTAAFKKLKINITGIMHAGSWTETDDVRTYMKNWAKYIEQGWFEFIDKIFVGSYFHRNEIIKRKRIIDSSKIKVTGLTFDSKEIYSMVKPMPWKDRKNQIIFPHRLHWEKQPEVFDKFIKITIIQ